METNIEAYDIAKKNNFLNYELFGEFVNYYTWNYGDYTSEDGVNFTKQDSNNKKVESKETSESYKDEQGIEYKYYKDLYSEGYAEVTGQEGDSSDIVIPSEVEVNGQKYKVSVIGEGAADRCYYVNTFIMDKNNNNFVSEDGVLFSRQTVATTTVTPPEPEKEKSIGVYEAYGTLEFLDYLIDDYEGLVKITVEEFPDDNGQKYRFSYFAKKDSAKSGDVSAVPLVSSLIAGVIGIAQIKRKRK